MYVLKIILVLLVARLGKGQSDYPSQSYDVTSSSVSTSSPEANEELRALSTATPQDVVSIGYTRHKTDRHKAANHSYQTSTESHDQKTSASTPYPVGYDQHSSSTQEELKYTSPSPNYESSTGAPPLPSQYLDTTLNPPVFEHYTVPTKYQNQDLYQPTRSPLLNHQSTPIALDYDKHGSTPLTSPPPPPLEQFKGTPAPLPPQYNPIGQYHPQVHFSPLPENYSEDLFSQPAPIPSSPYYPTPPPVPYQYDYYQSTPAPVPFEHYLSQRPTAPSPHYPPSPPPPTPQTSYKPASGSIHSTTTVTPHGELGTTTPSIYDYSTVAPLQPQYDFIRESYENTDTSQPPPQPYDHSLALAPPVPPQYDPSAYLTLPHSPHYLEAYRPYSTPLRKHNPSPSFEFNPTPHNPTHYIHNIPQYLTPSYDAYTRAPYSSGGHGSSHPHYFKPMYNPYNPSVPQYSSGPGSPGAQHYAHQAYASHYSPQISQHENYNYPPIYRPPVPPNYQPHQPPKHSTLYHLQASKELSPASSPATERTHELKESREYKQHGYHNYQVAEKPVSYNVREG